MNANNTCDTCLRGEWKRHTSLHRELTSRSEKPIVINARNKLVCLSGFCLINYLHDCRIKFAFNNQDRRSQKPTNIIYFPRYECVNCSTIPDFPIKDYIHTILSLGFFSHIKRCTYRTYLIAARNALSSHYFIVSYTMLWTHIRAVQLARLCTQTHKLLPIIYVVSSI